MRKAKWMLPLVAVSILILLGTSACGGVEGTTNSTIITPIQRIQNLESGLQGVWVGLAEGAQDYVSILDRVDLIREELDILAAQILDIQDILESLPPSNETVSNETQ